MTTSARRRLFVAIVGSAAVAAVAYVLWARHVRSPASGAPTDATERALAWPRGPALFYRSMARDESFGRVSFLPLGPGPQERLAGPVSCDRLYVRASRGLCLSLTDDVFAPHAASVFDEHWHERARWPLTGPPSRARISANGRYGAITVFESGHSYADDGFSTRTTIIDMDAGRELADLESFAVTKDGHPFRAVDFNFWGVTFAPDSRTWYATLATGGAVYLVEGDTISRSARVVRTGVECPSLSPDGRMIAFKKRASAAAGVHWGLAIWDRDTGVERDLVREARSIDDQVDWLDDTHLLYHYPSSRGADVWVLPTDGSDDARLFLQSAYSPSVTRAPLAESR